MRLVDATFDWIAANLKDDIDFVIWTGDSARHDNDDEIPRTSAQVIESNTMIANKFVELLQDPDNGRLAIPAVPNIGNNDILPHNFLHPGPNKWLHHYANIWKRFIPEEQRHTFEYGGWFYVEVIPQRLAVFSLNTLYFFNRNPGVDNCATPSEPGFKQLEWLRIQLAFMRQRGMKAMLIGHVPPARTGAKELWDDTCWQKYTLWLHQYRDVVITSLYGHMNIDHFFLQDSNKVDYYLVDKETPASELAEEDISIQSTKDYLLDLRNQWARLPKPVGLGWDESGDNVGDSDDESHEDSSGKHRKGNKKDRKKKKKKKKKKPKQDKPHAINSKWGERYSLSLVSPSLIPNYYPTLRVIEYNISGLEDAPVWLDDGPGPDIDGTRLEVRDALAQKEKGVPPPPSKSSPPGPAYSMQPLTLTGYTQYYANLTHLNNGGSKRKPAKPLEFKYDIEYSTVTDAVYNMSDLTVNSFLEFAYRMSQKTAAISGVEGRREKKTSKVEEHNEIWLRFLDRVFVKTVDREELEKLDN